METYEYVSVSGGKLHRPVSPAMERDQAWTPTLMTCGRTLTPSNYFVTRDDALRYCGQRTEHLCKRCDVEA